jgi:hypothetical protein
MLCGITNSPGKMIHTQSSNHIQFSCLTLKCSSYNLQICLASLFMWQHEKESRDTQIYLCRYSYSCTISSFTCLHGTSSTFSRERLTMSPKHWSVKRLWSWKDHLHGPGPTFNLRRSAIITDDQLIQYLSDFTKRVTFSQVQNWFSNVLIIAEGFRIPVPVILCRIHASMGYSSSTNCWFLRFQLLTIEANYPSKPIIYLQYSAN